MQRRSAVRMLCRPGFRRGRAGGVGVTLRAMVRGMGRNGEGGGIDCFGESGGVTFACVGPRAKGTHRARPGSGVKRRALPFHGGYGIDDWVGTTAYPDGLRGCTLIQGASTS